MFVGTWGLYNWFEEDGEELIHLSNRDNFRNLKPHGKLFQCVGLDGDFIEIQYHKQKYKVKPELYKHIPTPTFKFGEKVGVKGKAVCGVICDISWHSKDGREMYFIEVNGKKKTSRYFSEELLRMEGR